ncbi:hypothetical protein BGW38_004269 [Lunasporangiospora selenospora]|uniref:N-acetyltransferase domain-containing protein n=1 Tax=Lunasporangiospora selenospora TaxID=979761 RepID=A0A9P6G1C4_9FUNG|nr:hypothetical protein BGW38_004269 [Lunasporangiospora selenospora]
MPGIVCIPSSLALYLTVAMTVSSQIDRSEILIRPYKPEDYEQVLQFLVPGLMPVGTRHFQSRIKHPATTLRIITQSFFLSILIILGYASYIAAQEHSGHLYSQTTAIDLILTWLQKPVHIAQFQQSAPAVANWFIRDSGLVHALSKQGRVFVMVWVWMSMAVALVTISRMYKTSRANMENYIRQSFEDDLNDISHFYQDFEDPTLFSDDEDEPQHRNKDSKPHKNRSQFWVACLRSHPQLVFGCVGLDDNFVRTNALRQKHDQQVGDKAPFQRPDKGSGELRRMSVHPDYRRLGIGMMLLKSLEDHARAQGFSRVKLSTTFYQQEAIQGYMKFGFKLEKSITVDTGFVINFYDLDLGLGKEDKQTESFVSPVAIGPDQKVKRRTRVEDADETTL